MLLSFSLNPLERYDGTQILSLLPLTTQSFCAVHCRVFGVKDNLNIYISLTSNVALGKGICSTVQYCGRVARPKRKYA